MFGLVWDDYERVPDYRVRVTNKLDYCTFKMYDEISSSDISWAFHPRLRGFKKVDRVRLAIDIIENHINYVYDNPEKAKDKYKEVSIITVELESNQDMVDSKIVISRNSDGARVKFYDCAETVVFSFHGDERGAMKLSRLLAAIEILNKELYCIKKKMNDKKMG